MPRTTMSLPTAVWANRLSKVCFTVSVSTKVPAMKATPRMMAMAVRASRSLWASRLLMVARNTSAPEPLHLVEHLLRGGIGELVDGLAVGEEHHPVGVAGGHRV